MSVIQRFVILLLLVFPNFAFAYTWYVDKNGSGDFTILQDALNVMASGDTIRIGPGRYDEWQSYGPDWNVSKVRGYVNVGIATVIGSGLDTVIGPDEPWSSAAGQTHGFEVSSECSVLRLESIAFENLERAIMMGYGDSLSVAECWLRENRTHIATGSRYARIVGCEMAGVVSSGYGVVSYFQDRIILQRCSSSSEVDGTNTHLQVEGPSEVTVFQCQFVGANGGVRLSRGPTASISCSEFSGQASWGVSSSLGPTCSISDCVFDNQRQAIVGAESSGSVLIVDRVMFDSVSHSTLSALFLQDGYVHNSQLASGSHGVVANQQYGATLRKSGIELPTHFDMRNNWWGTTDPDSIAALITDFNDNDDVHYIIDYEPFLDGPVGVERRSLGDIKALFR